ncbi:REP-associated tyrosine transposase [Hydromonas duriensis]|uniref:Putative transposase n=1 Tax=Hydromonas duriensis TaxID=1527608 RepID=A0A4R6Y0L8_9BURK|nr:transposase [Hydromonas duriensis]TDR28845.1 putative transposase [Hydromonas duriensis]
MPNYRRSNVAGATYFFTVVTHQRQPILCDGDVRLALREAIGVVRAELSFEIDAWVLMPDHLHAIWTLPEHDADFGKRWGEIKRYVSQQCGGRLNQTWRLSDSNIKRRESSVWQRRFWEHQVRDDADFERCINYAYYNPVKHGLVERVADWPHSTFHRYVKQGVYPLNWGEGLRVSDGHFGELD